MTEGEHTAAGVDVLHPLARLHLVCCHSWRGELQEVISKMVEPVHCVLLQDIVAILDWGYDGDIVYISSTNNLSSWTSTKLPHNYTSLSTYQDQLVAVGGRHHSTNALTNKLLTSSNGRDWQSTLPAMPTAREYTSAVSAKSPAVILVVAGGRNSYNWDLDIVELLLGNQWSTVSSLPTACSEMRYTVHAGSIYFTPKPGRGNIMYACTCESLCAPHDDRMSIRVWTKIQVPDDTRTIASCGSRLVSIDRYRMIRGYNNGRWIETTVEGDWEDQDIYYNKYMNAAELPTGGLIVANVSRVFTLTLSVDTFDPDSMFISNILSRLEVVMGLKIVSALASIHQQFATSSGVTLKSRKGILGFKLQLPDPQTAPCQYVEEVVLQWSTGHSPRPSTWRELLHVLHEVGQLDLRQQIETFMKGDARYFGAYLHFVGTKESLDLLFLKLLFFGSPRLGKTTVRRRLMGEIIDLVTAGEDDSAQPSTGAVESENVIVRRVSGSTAMVTQSEWSSVEDLNDEVCMLFYNLVDTIAGISRESLEPTHFEVISTSEQSSRNGAEMKSSLPTSSSSSQNRGTVAELTRNIPSQSSRGMQVTSLEQEAPEILAMFHEAMRSKYWKDVKHMFKAYLRVEDTGGQPELMDMLPALTIGPGLYLLFVNLQNNLDHHYKLSYCDKSGTSTPPVESVYTVKELLLTCLSSISCSNASFSTSCLDGKESSNISNVENILKSSQSVAYIVGTHKDKVSRQQIKKLNEELMKVIETTDFYKKGIIQFFSNEELIVTLDNLKGGTHEINMVKNMLEKIIERLFRKLQVPAVWLIFSLLLRRRKKRTASLANCMGLSASLHMTRGETEVALWFLHHHAGVLMYFPNIFELKDLVIIDVQVVYDSVTILILRAMDWEEVGHYNAKTFRKTGKFTIRQLTAITSKVSGDFIPIDKLVVLLEYLHIIARISPHQQTTSSSEEEVTYIMPCVLDSANKEELDTISKKPHEVCPIMVHFKCGFVPIGIFTAMIACLINNKLFTLIEGGIKKNAVQFLYGVHKILITFLCRPMYYSFTISEIIFQPKLKLHKECSTLRKEIKASFDRVCSRMNYGALMEYEFAFVCPIHTECGHDHLCVINTEESSPVMMECLLNEDYPKPVPLNDQHKLWYGEAMSNIKVVSVEEPLAPMQLRASPSLCQHEHEYSGRVMMDCLLNMEDQIPVRLTDQHKLWHGKEVSTEEASSGQAVSLTSQSQSSRTSPSHGFSPKHLLSWLFYFLVVCSASFFVIILLLFTFGSSFIFINVHSPTLTLDGKPTMSQFRHFTCARGSVDIVQEVANQCKKLGYLLQLPEAMVINDMSVNSNGDIVDKCETIIFKWLQGHGATPVTWRAFIDVLNKMKYLLADELLEELSKPSRDNLKDL